MSIRRMQPPVGYKIAVGSLLQSAVRASTSRNYREEVLERRLAETCGVSAVRAVSSGKAALTVILTALHRLSGRTKVIIPAYTCYSVPSAIVKAGLEVVPCDIAPSLDYDYELLAPLLQRDVLCVLSVHLFGIPADVQQLQRLCRGTGIVVVEDAAQAFGNTHNGKQLGTAGDVGFFSLGRGKPVTCGSGGLIVSRSDTISRAIAEVTAGQPRATLAQEVATFIGLLSLSLLISPRLYWFPASLPFLRLGETIFHEEFPVHWMSDFQCLLLRDWQAQLGALNAVRMENVRYYRTHIPAASSCGEAMPCVRFPLLLSGGQEKRRILVERQGTALGISGMYPGSVAAIPQLKRHLQGAVFPTADHVAASLITLPTHPLLSHQEREKIAALVTSVTRTPRPEPTAAPVLSQVRPTPEAH